jgi:hypothetical protein
MTDINTICTSPPCRVTSKGSIHKGACGAARRQAREAEFDRAAEDYRQRARRPREPADEVLKLERIFHALLEDANAAEAGMEAPARRDWVPRQYADQLNRPTQELLLSTQLGLVLARLLDLGETYPAARDTAAVLERLLEPLRARLVFRASAFEACEQQFVAPMTIPRRLAPYAIRQAVERLAEAGYLPLRADNVPTDAALGRDRRLLQWFLSLDD